MDDDPYPGPICKRHGLSVGILSRNDLFPISEISNGLIFELKTNLGSTRHLLSVLHVLDQRFKTASLSAIDIKIRRLLEKKKKLAVKKKVTGYNSVQDLLNEKFVLPSTQLKLPHNTTNNSAHKIVKDFVNNRQSMRCVEISESESCSEGHPETDSDTSQLRVCRDETYKKCNLMQYGIDKKQKLLDKTNKDISDAEAKLGQLQKMMGHYSVKNVNKRDETNRKNMHLLRESQRKVIKQSKCIDQLQKANEENQMKLTNLDSEYQKLLNSMNEYKEVKEALKNMEKKKIHAQKTASYYKRSAKQLKEKIANSQVPNEVENSTRSKQSLQEKDRVIDSLNIEVERLHDLLQNTVQTKNKDGAYTDSIRICVIELTGLEVANEKVSPVITAVAKHLFGKEFAKEDLPSSKTIQTIVDEGHYMAKTFIAEKLSETTSWGLGRDGTTRKKHKLLDTSVTLASGDVMSLGFTRVFKETAAAINATTKQHISELAQLHTDSHSNQCTKEETRENFVRLSLKKLAFSMSDRAANEKKANELLTEWRNDVLNQCKGDQQHTEVLQFYCMAHVLLGFHTYTCRELVPYEADLAEQFGPLGRSALKCFQYWRNKGTAVERVVRTVSEVFGPAGDHHGVRDVWEAFCAANGVKSLIGNYRDNRFNALFQTSAEILVHRHDFITILETLKSPNLLLKSVLADLQCGIIAVLLQCLGLFYVKLTGPYWNLVANSDVPYLSLHEHIKEMRSFLDKCEVNPAEILISTQHWSEEDPASVAAIPHRARLSEIIFTIQEDYRDQLFAGIKCVATAMKTTVTKQLADFLPGGKFCTVPQEVDLARTRFGQSTNLACEHHFGDLDSSQRRRPSATLHHHSSVQLIKRNRIKMINWLYAMEGNKRKDLLRTARKGGKALRDLHVQCEKNVLAEIHHDMKFEKKKRKNGDSQDGQPRRRRLNEKDCDGMMDDDVSALHGHETMTCTVNEYVAVAYEDRWYPGIVTEKKDDDKIIVKFLDSTKSSGVYQWPQRDDFQLVNAEYILKSGFIPECLHSGRMWSITEFREIGRLYLEYRKKYFS